jgi:hypothetical protein
MTKIFGYVDLSPDVYKYVRYVLNWAPIRKSYSYVKLPIQFINCYIMFFTFKPSCLLKQAMTKPSNTSHADTPPESPEMVAKFSGDDISKVPKVDVYLLGDILTLGVVAGNAV